MEGEWRLLAGERIQDSGRERRKQLRVVSGWKRLPAAALPRRNPSGRDTKNPLEESMEEEEEEEEEAEEEEEEEDEWANGGNG